MKLSEAMMLASTMGEVPTNSDWNCCLIGISCHAIGQTNYMMESHLRWPWLNHSVMVPRCESIWAGSLCVGSVLATSLCDQVTGGEISVMRAAEIIATVEPQDTQNEQTDGGQVPHPTDVSRSDEVQNIGV